MGADELGLDLGRGLAAFPAEFGDEGADAFRPGGSGEETVDGDAGAADGFGKAASESRIAASS